MEIELRNTQHRMCLGILYYKIGFGQNAFIILQSTPEKDNLHTFRESIRILDRELRPNNIMVLPLPDNKPRWSCEFEDLKTYAQMIDMFENYRHPIYPSIFNFEEIDI